MKYTHIYPLPLTSWPHYIIIVFQKEMGSPCGNGTKFKVKIWPWLLTSKSTEVLLGSRLIHVWSIIIVCQKEMELSNGNGGKTNCKMFKVQIWPWFLTYWPQIERGPSQAMVNTSVKYHYSMPKINGYDVETIQSLKTKYNLVLWSFDPKINRGPSQVEVNTFVKYHYCMPKVNEAVVWKR